MKQQIGTIGMGTLVGYQSYDVRNRETGELETNHAYYVLSYEGKDEKTGLYSVCSIREIRQPKQTIKDLKSGIPVRFKVLTTVYDGRMSEKCSDLEAIQL